LASRYLLCCEALETTKETYAFTVLERVFKDFGLPLAIRTDNGVPFASRQHLLRLEQTLGVVAAARELYSPSLRPYRGLTDPEYPFHDRAVLVTHCGRICLGKRKISLSHVFAGQWVGIREIEEKIWLVSFMNYDLGFFDHETPCAPNRPQLKWRRGWDSNPRAGFTRPSDFESAPL
jgi:hypothetical protein